MFGLIDDLQDLKRELIAALKLLVEVGKGNKTAEDVQKWLQENYPEMCHACGETGQTGKFCAKCGEGQKPIPADQAESACSDCEATGQTGKFCTDCGAELNSSDEETD